MFTLKVLANFSILVLLYFDVMASPSSITFQSRIAKPDGNVLQESSVHFRMSITDTVGSCVIYQEDFTNRNMSGSKGLINLTLGSGTRVFPAAPMTLNEVFNNYNSPTFNCQSGGSINAGTTDRRKLIMQFNDGSGWQTVPAMDINSTPYAMHSMSSQYLGSYPAADYLRAATMPTCNGAEALHFNGTSFTCVSIGGAGSVVSVTSANADIDVTNSTSAPVLTLNVGTGANQIIKLNGAAELPAVSGANLTALNAGSLSSGTLPVGRLPSFTGGDVTSSAGSASLSIASGAISDGHINSSAQIARSKIATGSAGHVVVNGIGGGLSSLTCGLNQIIKFDGSGTAGCATDNSGGSGDINQNGNSFAAAMIVGTNDNNSLSFETNGTTKVSILSNGNVGIGTTNPTNIFQVEGGNAVSGAPSGISLKSQSSIMSGGSAYNGSNIDIIAGHGYLSGLGGSINLTAGRGNLTSGATGYGGSLVLNGSANAGPPGGLVLSGGNGGNGYGGAGSLTMSASGTTAGGNLTVVAGSPTTGNSNGGDVYINGGVKSGSGADGNVIIGYSGGQARGLAGIGTATPVAKLDVAGEVKVGNTALACSSTTKGSIRYNTGTDVLEFCNGTSWNLLQAAACSDPTPAAIVFTDETNATSSTLTTSNIVQVTGINCSVPVQISGTGSPQFRICSDSGCGSVVQGWTSTPSTITNNQYLQVQLTADSVGGSSFQSTLIIGSGATVWTVTTAGGDCVGTTPPVGTVCADGTIYAGLSPDGSVKMFTTRCDFGQSWNGSTCTGSRSSLSWNNGTGTRTNTGYTSTSLGKSNSAAVAGLSDGASPHIAAQNCEALSSNGHTDWYLPSQTELSLLYAGRNSIRQFDTTTPGYYWSSTEENSDYAKVVRLSDGFVDGGYYAWGYKNFLRFIRCVRR